MLFRSQRWLPRLLGRSTPRNNHLHPHLPPRPSINSSPHLPHRRPNRHRHPPLRTTHSPSQPSPLPILPSSPMPPAAQKLSCPPNVRRWVSAPTSTASKLWTCLRSRESLPRSVLHPWELRSPRPCSSSASSSQASTRPPPARQVSSTSTPTPRAPSKIQVPYRKAWRQPLL